MDTIEIEILEDGRVKVTTDKISVGNHRNADELLQLIETLMAGKVESIKRKQGHGHVHVHEHAKQG